MAKKRDAFTVTPVALPTCGGCDRCGDLHDLHLYVLGYDKKYYCHDCFRKIAVKWPKPAAKVGQSGTRLQVSISEEWYARAVACGTARFEESMRLGLKRDAGLPGENSNRGKMLADHILGAAGEVAWAKLSGQPWKPTVNTFASGGDVSIDQVRTRSKSWYDLNIKQKDARVHAESNFVLMLGEHGGRDFVAVGWIGCRDAQRDEWVKAPGGGRPGWFVPQNKLHPFPIIDRSQSDRKEVVHAIQSDDHVQD